MLQAAYAAELLDGSAEPAACYRVTADGILPAEAQAADLKTILAVSFGLGGSYSAVIIKRTGENV